MLCYRDMTFCTYYKECTIGENCHRALTEEVKQKAEAWSKNIGIAQFADKPDCFKEVNNEQEKESI